MKSKLGYYITAQGMAEMAETLRVTRPRGVVTMRTGDPSAIKATSPATLVIYRHFFDNESYRAGKADGARWFAEMQADVAATRAHVDYYMAINEPAIFNEPDARLLCAATQEWNRLMHSAGVKTLSYAFPEGHPELGLWKYLKDGIGDGIILHEYDAPEMWRSMPTSSPFREGAGVSERAADLGSRFLRWLATLFRGSGVSHLTGGFGGVPQYSLLPPPSPPGERAGVSKRAPDLGSRFLRWLATLFRGSGVTPLTGEFGGVPQYSLLPPPSPDSGREGAGGERGFKSLQVYRWRAADLGWRCLRYRRVLNELNAAGVDTVALKIVIGETGIDGGVAGVDRPQQGWKAFGNIDHYIESLNWYDREICRDVQVLFAAIFAANWNIGGGTFNVEGEGRIKEHIARDHPEFEEESTPSPAPAFSTTFAETLIKTFERFSASAYREPNGTWSIGFGHNIQPGEKFPSAITRDTAVVLLHRDVQRYAEAVRASVKVALSAEQFAALVSFCYNVGINAFLGSTLLEKLNRGDYAGAARELVWFDAREQKWHGWVFAQGKVLMGLVERRLTEQELFNGH